MQLHLNATKPPDITFSSSGGNLTIFGDVVVEVVSPTNKSLQQAFALGMVREFEGERDYRVDIYIILWEGGNQKCSNPYTNRQLTLLNWSFKDKGNSW